MSPSPPAAFPATRVTERHFTVMASRAHVILVDPAPGAEAYAVRRLEELERRWSRFRDTSDVSRLNASPEAMLVVSADTIALLTAMKEAARVTGGRYDPTMLEDIVAAGYDTSVDGSGRRSRGLTYGAHHRLEAGRTGSRRARAGGGVAGVLVDPAASTATVPAGVGLDAGGIGKGLAADLVVTELLAGGTGGALVAVGGDLAAAGSPPSAEGWQVRVEDPLQASQSIARLSLQAGGVATSSTRSRRWAAPGGVRHHVLEPSTGACSGTDLAAVTVVARSGWEAEAHATAALLCGGGDALGYLEARGFAGLATTAGGVTTSVGLHDRSDDERSSA